MARILEKSMGLGSRNGWERFRQNLLRLENQTEFVKKYLRRFDEATRIDLERVDGLIIDPKAIISNQAFLTLPDLQFFPEGYNPSAMPMHNLFDFRFLLTEEAVKLFVEPEVNFFGGMISYHEQGKAYQIHTAIIFSSPDISDLRAFQNSTLMLERKKRKGHWDGKRWIVKIGRVEDKEKTTVSSQTDSLV